MEPNIDFDISVEVFGDEKDEQTIETIHKQTFSTVKNSIANFGLVSYPVWIRVAFNGDLPDTVDRLFLSINFPPLDEVLFFIPERWVVPGSYTRWENASANYNVKALGDLVPFSNRDIESPNYVIDFKPNLSSPQAIYIRVKTTSNLQAPIAVYTPNQRARDEIKNTLIYGGYFGLMIVMILYNGFIYLSTRAPAYLYYVLFNCALLILQVTNRGYAYQFLWPNAVTFNQNMIFGFSGLAFLFGAMFIRAFMETKKVAPFIDKLLIGGAIMGGMQAILASTGMIPLSAKISVLIGLFLPLTAIVLGVIRVKAKDRKAFLFLLAWSVLLLAAVAWHLTLSGVLPMTGITNYFLVIGSALEVTLLSIALADEINRQKQNAILHEQNEQKVRIEKNAAEQANKAKSVFLTNISHELRTPLNAIIGFSQRVLLKTQDTLEPRYVDALKTVTSNGEHLLQLVNNLIDLAQIESGKLTLNKSYQSIETLCTEVGLQLKPLVDEKGLNLELQLDHGSEKVGCDPVRMKQVLINLVNNAIKFTDAGTITVATKHVQSQDGGWVIISVTDTGIGISPEVLDKLFQRFQRDSVNANVLQIEGSGLGLAVTKEIIELHGGDISVHSEQGSGTTFEVKIPMQ